MPGLSVPIRGLRMGTLVACACAIASALRWMFDLAAMAVGVAPLRGTVSAMAVVPLDLAASKLESQANWAFEQDEKLTRHHREALGLWDATT